VEQQIGRITLGSELTPEASAGSIAYTEIGDDRGIPQAATLEIARRFRTAMKLKLIMIDGPGQQLTEGWSGSHARRFLPQMRNALAKRHMEEKLDKADQIATLAASMTVKQVPAGIDIEGRARVPVQRTKPHKLLPGAAPAGSPVMPLQIVQQREVLFELFQVRVHGVVFLPKSRLRGIGLFSQARMVGGKDFKGAVARPVAGTKPGWATIKAKHRDGSPHRVPGTGPPKSVPCAGTKTKAASNRGCETSGGE
jgi:hypothetical protein